MKTATPATAKLPGEMRSRSRSQPRGRARDQEEKNNRLKISSVGQSGSGAVKAALVGWWKEEREGRRGGGELLCIFPARSKLLV